MDRDLSGSRKVTCAKCHKELDLIWSNGFGAVMALCPDCGTINFSLNATLLDYMKELYKRGYQQKYRLKAMMLEIIRQRFTWIEPGIRDDIVNLLVNQHYDAIVFEVKAKEQEAKNE